jgi:hypothetical protein
MTRKLMKDADERTIPIEASREAIPKRTSLIDRIRSISDASRREREKREQLEKEGRTGRDFQWLKRQSLAARGLLEGN